MRDQSQTFTPVKQVAGDHYKSIYGHWDWVADMINFSDMSYFEGNATKYLCRWKKKGGKQDLEKAISYVFMLEKLYLDDKITRDTVKVKNNNAKIAIMTVKLSDNNDIGSDEQNICFNLAIWKNQKDLLDVVASIRELIANAV